MEPNSLVYFGFSYFRDADEHSLTSSIASDINSARTKFQSAPFSHTTDPETEFRLVRGQVSGFVEVSPKQSLQLRAS